MAERTKTGELIYDPRDYLEGGSEYYADPRERLRFQGETVGGVNPADVQYGYTPQEQARLSASQSGDPYAAFKARWAQEYPDQPLTQDILNSNEMLAGKKGFNISNDLFRLLPLDRQMAFPSERLGQLDNADLMKLVDHNPNVASGFPTDFWKRFSNDWLAKTVLPFFKQNNPEEAENLVQQNQIGGSQAQPAQTAGGMDRITPVAQSPAEQAGAYGTENYFGTGYDIPRLKLPDVSGLGRDAGAVDLFRGYTGTGAQGRTSIQQIAEQQNVGQWGDAPQRLINPVGDVQYDPDKRARLSGEAADPDTQPEPPFPAPPGKSWNFSTKYDPIAKAYAPSWELVDARREPRGYAPRPPLEKERAQADLDRTQADIEMTRAQLADLPRQIADAQAKLALAKQSQDFQEASFWQSRLDNLAKQQTDMAYNRDRLGLEADLGYAGSRRADLGANLQRAGVTGYYGGKPTMEREKLIGDTERANLQLQASLGSTAAQLRLQEVAQAEGSRQFDKSYGLQERAQGLSEELGRGRLGLEREQFGFQVARDPASAIVKTRNLYGVGAQEGAAPTTQQAIDSPYTGQATRAALGGMAAGKVNPGVPLPSNETQRKLLPSEAAELTATYRGLGYNPEDIFEKGKRLTSAYNAPQRARLPI